MVDGLENRFDRMITSGAGAEVPTAEAIAAEVEEYLASFEGETGGSEGISDADGTDGPESPEEPEGPASPTL